MDRGRPRKRTSSRNKNGSEPRQSVAVPEETITQTTFDKLPSGSRPEHAAANMTTSQAGSLQRQALRQAMQFEVLSAGDVEALSKELHRLDERTQYLRNTYNSIRAGRRNLQERICQFHRIARVAKYSCDTMLKQEEALADLDACIDEWVNKLERAEDRRTRIRQKLLEHVAAAAIMSIPDLVKTTVTEGSDDTSEQAAENHTPTLHGIFTPPRSPSRNGSPASSASPPRLAAHVPSTILEQPVVEAEEEESFNETQVQASSASVVSTSSKREEVQSIRVYAGDDIYTLLADVESEMTKMRHSVNEAIREALPETEPTSELEHDRSAELLCGLEELTIPDLVGRRRSLSSPLPNSPPAPPPPIKDFPIKKRYSRDVSSML
uniref:Up-regulated during septation protein 1 domain-containing protein n=1 Tax=Bionectria ochroleuca TaxID=29856 RepID=A0A0B7KG16_BIOOC